MLSFANVSSEAYLGLGFLALCAGPLMVYLLRSNAWSTVALDSFCLITISGFALLHLLPESAEQAGWLVLPLALLGFVLPSIAERTLHHGDAGVRKTVLLLAVFGTSVVISSLSAQRYLQQQLSIKNADNATALALSLSQQGADPVLLRRDPTDTFRSQTLRHLVVASVLTRSGITATARPRSCACRARGPPSCRRASAASPATRAASPSASPSPRPP